MNRHRLVVLAVVAAVGAAAALWSTQTRKPAQEISASEPLVPGLQEKLNDVSQLRVIGPGGKPLTTIVRGEAGWSLQEKGGYAVDTDQVRDFLMTLAKARRVEAKTSSEALYAKLGVGDVAKADAIGVQVEIDGLAKPVAVILGHNVLRGNGTFVRNAGDAQSWQTDINIAAEREPAKWLQAQIVDVAPGKVESLTIKPAEGAAIEIVRAPAGGSAEFTLRNVPKGRELESEFVADAAAGLLSGLRLDDVAPEAEAEPGDAALTTSEFRIEDGTVITLTSWKANDKTLARLVATLDETRATAFAEAEVARAAKEAAALAGETAEKPADAPAGTLLAADDAGTAASATDAAPASTPAQPAATAAAAPDAQQRLATVRDNVAALQAKFAPWTYTLPSYKAGNLNKSLEDYLKPKG